MFAATVALLKRSSHCIGGFPEALKENLIGPSTAFALFSGSSRLTPKAAAAAREKGDKARTASDAAARTKNKLRLRLGSQLSLKRALCESRKKDAVISPTL
jgi:hypothetical protein